MLVSDISSIDDKEEIEGDYSTFVSLIEAKASLSINELPDLPFNDCDDEDNQLGFSKKDDITNFISINSKQYSYQS